MVINAKAFAKINLFLEITGKRPDGYHNLETIMQTVGLCDELSFELSEDVSLSVNSTFHFPLSTFPTDSQNIIIKAAFALKQKFNITQGVKITLAKNIPTGAGLGGGSSDAAATLKSLIKLWNIKIDSGELNAIAARLGADVPFFLTGGTALCEGIGEIVSQLRVTNYELRDKYSLVIVKPSVSVSTPEAYKKVKLPFKNPQNIKAIKTAIENGSFGLQRAKELCFNRFEELVFPDYPEIAKVKEVLTNAGCAAMMSGSGSAVFGFFNPADKVKVESTISNFRHWFIAA